MVRVELLVLGAVALAVGLVLNFVAILDAGSSTLGGETELEIGTYGVLVASDLSVTWNATPPTNFEIEDCGTSPPDSGGNCPSSYSVLYHQYGHGGAFSLTVPNWHHLIFWSSGTATVDVHATRGDIGTALIIVGAVLMGAGVLKRRPERQRPARIDPHSTGPAPPPSTETPATR